MSTASQRELGLLLDIVASGDDDEVGPGVPWPVLERLQQLIPCDDSVSYQELDLGERRALLIQGVSDGGREVLEPQPGGDEAEEPFWNLFWASAFCSYPQRTGDLVSIVQTTDFGSLAMLGNDPMYREWVRPAGITHEMIVSLPAAPGRTRRVLLARAIDKPFSEHERALLSLLRPHLYEISRRAEHRRQQKARLTPREREVLTLVAAGQSNADIAATLFISVATVRKHIEHARERLGVRSRTTAASLALHDTSVDVARHPTSR